MQKAKWWKWNLLYLQFTSEMIYSSDHGIQSILNSSSVSSSQRKRPYNILFYIASSRYCNVLSSNPISYFQLVVVHSSIFCIIHCHHYCVEFHLYWKKNNSVWLTVSFKRYKFLTQSSATARYNVCMNSLHEFNWPCIPILTYIPWKVKFLFNVVDNGITSWVFYLYLQGTLICMPLDNNKF